MDYSLLLCIEKREPGSATTPPSDSPSLYSQGKALVNGSTTDGSETLLSPHSRHQVTFNSKGSPNEKPNSFHNASRHQIESDCGTMIYHLAIIDYLQAWNFDKKVEAFLKRTIKGRPRD
jgi:hypothetical protein